MKDGASRPLRVLIGQKAAVRVCRDKVQVPTPTTFNLNITNFDMNTLDTRIPHPIAAK